MNYIKFLAPAETTQYMILGFSVIFGTIIFYIVSLNNRKKRNQADYDMLMELKDKK